MAKIGGNPQNLKPFQKGEDPRRNVTGENRILPDEKELFANALGEDDKGKTKAELIVRKMVKKAEAGDLRAAEWLFDRGYGKVTQKTETDITSGGQPFSIKDLIGFKE